MIFTFLLVILVAWFLTFTCTSDESGDNTSNLSFWEKIMRFFKRLFVIVPTHNNKNNNNNNNNNNNK